MATSESLLTSPSQQEDENFTECVSIRALGDNSVEDIEMASVMIDVLSLMPNDEVGEPSQLEYNIVDINNGTEAVTRCILVHMQSAAYFWIMLL